MENITTEKKAVYAISDIISDALRLYGQETTFCIEHIDLENKTCTIKFNFEIDKKTNSIGFALP
jgi:hypothetical protein